MKKYGKNVLSSILLGCAALGSIGAYAGEGDGTRGGGGTFSVTFREGLARAAESMRATESLPGNDEEGAILRAIYREKRQEWIQALETAIKDSSSVRVTPRWLTDEGVEVAAYASNSDSERVIDLSIPYLLQSGLTADQAFVLAVHETGHWILRKEELTDHSDLERVGLLLLEAKRAEAALVAKKAQEKAPEPSPSAAWMYASNDPDKSAFCRNVRFEVFESDEKLRVVGQLRAIVRPVSRNLVLERVQFATRRPVVHRICAHPGEILALSFSVSDRAEFKVRAVDVESGFAFPTDEDAFDSRKSTIGHVLDFYWKRYKR